MSIATFSLPVDIPWRRLCVSEDMIDSTICDRKFPYRWRSSVAVFAYQPPDDQQTYDNMTVSYLKVACTITSFQPNPEEVGLKDRRVDSYWDTPLLIADYADTVSQAYPCYGAILEVAVAPSAKIIDGSPIPLSDYPYFMDFDPKKREIYELVTDTGENMSRSLDEVSVGKSASTSNTHEKLDILNGISVSAQASVLGTGGGGSFSTQGQWGTRDITQQESADTRTTDTSREARENNSHTTQLTQMYQQLNSYHLGTNRAVFFVLPRPHIIDDKDTPLTFINGPRRLEGIQEFFLVVVRPKKIADICVEAYLETAHVGQVATYGNVVRRDTDTTTTLSLSVASNPTNPKAVRVKSGSITYTARAGWAIDTATSGGYNINLLKQSGKTSCAVSAIDAGHLVLSGEVKTDFIVDKDTGKPPGSEDGGSGGRGPTNKPSHGEVEGVDGALEANATVHLQQGGRVQTGSALGLYITGRGVCCCADQEVAAINRRLLTESVNFEQHLLMPYAGSVGGTVRMRAADANQLRAEIDRAIVKSISSPDRYERGTMNFAQTQLVARNIASLISDAGHPDDHPIADIRGLDAGILQKISAVKPGLTRSDLLVMAPAEQQDRFGLDVAEMLQLRDATVGLAGAPPEPARRWDPPGSHRDKHDDVAVPLLIGLSTEQAEALLSAASLTFGASSVVDSPLPAGSVVTQTPAAGGFIRSGAHVAFEVASGLTVRLPEIAGQRLSVAFELLRDAGLRSEPTVRGNAEPAARAAALDPEPGSVVTPNSAVTITLRYGPN